MLMAILVIFTGVDQLTAMRWTRQIWDEFPGKIIFNCWKITGLLDEKLSLDNARIEEVDGEEEIETDLNNLIHELAQAVSRMSIQNLIPHNVGVACEAPSRERCLVLVHYIPKRPLT